LSPLTPAICSRWPWTGMAGCGAGARTAAASLVRTSTPRPARRTGSTTMPA